MPVVLGKKILITGGAGFIATSIGERLVEDNELTLFDLSFGADQPINYSALTSHPSVTTLEGDIRDQDRISEAVQDVDVIIHAAAVVGVNRVLQAARSTIETNLLGTVNLIRAAHTHCPELERLIYFSTSEVFGGSSFRVDEANVASIGSVDEARWSYSISKLAGEHLAFAYYREFGMPVTIVRPFNVFGPGRTGDHAVLRFISAALKGSDLVVYGDGAQVRSWCYIDDFVDAIMAMLDTDEAVGSDFNIGNSRNTLTIYELAKRVLQLTESDSQIVFEHIEHSDIDLRVPSTRKAGAILGYEPRIEIEEALRHTIDWYREHPETMILD
ncbi:MAG: NAD-dependent epimerase/dehydratase family protein [Acidimicrobiia bacterium]|nr:NAD-dependent epimerase/dehydratase family protein [Acidimicrobiia bacterium]NNC42524.1 NAD-dependent epimerase/dehydratase family protein [Acidimicrobiia bacterium]NNL27118.1 NAD-dependent epimerase/dehydratase family protein [Acidimicrobiia bacterium]